MSTRATIKMGDGWHLYRELLDGTTHLEIHRPIEVSFEASESSVDLVIPDHVLMSIREIPQVVQVLHCSDCEHFTHSKDVERCDQYSIMKNPVDCPAFSVKDKN